SHQPAGTPHLHPFPTRRSSDLAALPPSWPTKSISTNPGTASSHSAHVRIGIWLLSNEPGLVCDRPRASILARSGASLRSMVAGRSEEHTSELQSRFDLVCRLLL